MVQTDTSRDNISASQKGQNFGELGTSQGHPSSGDEGSMDTGCTSLPQGDSLWGSSGGPWDEHSALVL